MPVKRHTTHSRTNSATKVTEHSRRHIKSALAKKGFTLEHDESEDDEWTSESGATTPSHLQDSDDDESPALTRIETARQSDFARPQIIKRQSSTRPSSTYSLRLDGRPHPLIRGQSFGHPRPAPLEPLTVKPQVSSSPPEPSSPESIQSRRRTSISSARSVATLPSSTPWYHNNPSTRSLTTSSSTAASSLAFAMHHPMPHLTSSFFPPRYSIPVEKIHPLLPAPYMASHLSVLANRTPIKESYDRVIKAKQNAR